MDHRQCVGNDAFNPARAFVYSNASFSSALGSPATVAVSRSRSSAETAAKGGQNGGSPHLVPDHSRSVDHHDAT